MEHCILLRGCFLPLLDLDNEGTETPGDILPTTQGHKSHPQIQQRLAHFFNKDELYIKVLLARNGIKSLQFCSK